METQACFLLALPVVEKLFKLNSMAGIYDPATRLLRIGYCQLGKDLSSGWSRTWVYAGLRLFAKT